MIQRKRKLFDKRYIPHERRRNLILACILFWSILATIAVKQWGFGAVEVDGTSMEPTLHSGERSVVHRWLYYYRRPARGEVVVIRHPGDGTLSVKRVVGLAGETVEIVSGAVLVNGKPLSEPYLNEGVKTLPEGKKPNSWRLGPEEYFVLGDNRPDSEDSRFFGPLKRDEILGKIRNPRLPAKT